VSRPRSTTRSILIWVAGLLLIGAIGVYLWGRRSDLASLVDIPPYQVLIVGVLIAFGHWLNSLEFWLLYRSIGGELSITENWLLFTAGQLVNHLPGQAGTLYRFKYLKSVHGLGYGLSASAYAANLVITVLATSALGLGGSISVGSQTGKGNGLILGGFGLLLLGALGVLIVRLPTSSGDGWFARKWSTFHAGWSDITRHPRVAVTVTAIEVLKYIVGAFRLQLAFSWIGVEAPFAVFLVLAAVVGLVGFIAITPAALGVREVAIGGVAAALGTSLDQSLFGATIDRVVLLLVSILLGSLGLAYTSRRLIKSAVAEA
jgi:uncharacterized membrane protein YbhN (UPF0104 family)